jgi:lysophospholipase L1-like esterase
MVGFFTFGGGIMREKRMRRILIWVVLLALVLGQGNMTFAAKPNPTSSLDITTGDLEYTIPEDQAFLFSVDATMKDGYSVVWSHEPLDSELLQLIEVVKTEKSTRKSTTYFENAKFIFTPIDDDQPRTITFTIIASEDKDGTINKDQISVTFHMTPVTTEINTPPVAEDDYVEGIVGTELLIEPLRNDSDPDGDNISLFSVISPDGTSVTVVGNIISFTPLEAGTVTLQYFIKDDDEAISNQGEISVVVTEAEVEMTFVYLALGDSIPAGYSAEKSLPKTIDSYTDKIFNTLVNRYDNVEYYDTSVSGLNISDVYDQVKNYSNIRGYIASANLITLCIGANDIMDAAPESTFGRDFYNIDWNIADSGLNNIYDYWDDIINEIYFLNSDVELVVMNMYNPYTISDSKLNATGHEVYGREKMHFLVDKYFYSVEDLNPSKNDGIDYGLNYIIENPDLVYENFTHQYKIVNVYDNFESNDPTKSRFIAFYENYYLLWGFYPIQIKDPHPTLLGQTKLYELHSATMGW